MVRGDFADPVPAAEVVEKFISLASGVLGADRARAVSEIVDQVETLKDVRDLTALLSPLATTPSRPCPLPRGERG